MSDSGEPFGRVVQMHLPERRPHGHEQTGLRPCLVVSDPGRLQRLAFPMLVVAPITSTLLTPGMVRVRLEAGAGGLERPGTVLLDQLAATDAGRLLGVYGVLTDEELEPVRTGLRAVFGPVLGV